MSDVFHLRKRGSSRLGSFALLDRFSRSKGVAADPPAFANTVAPVVSGTTMVGETLSVTDGTWTPTPAGYTYQWRRGGSTIGGATSDTYELAALDEGELIDCLVTANDGGSESTTVASNSVGPITAEVLDLYGGGSLELYGGGSLELYTPA